MKVQIRRNVFETNSSSVHSITMCSEDEYKKWRDGELLFSDWDEEFVDINDSEVKEAREKYEKEFKEWENDPDAYSWNKPDCEYVTCDDFWRGLWLIVNDKENGLCPVIEKNFAVNANGEIYACHILNGNVDNSLGYLAT